MIKIYHGAIFTHCWQCVNSFKSSITKWKGWVYVVVSWHNESFIQLLIQNHHHTILCQSATECFQEKIAGIAGKVLACPVLQKLRWELFGKFTLEVQQIIPTMPLNSWISSILHYVTFWEGNNLIIQVPVAAARDKTTQRVNICSAGSFCKTLNQIMNSCKDLGMRQIFTICTCELPQWGNEKPHTVLENVWDSSKLKIFCALSQRDVQIILFIETTWLIPFIWTCWLFHSTTWRSNGHDIAAALHSSIHSRSCESILWQCVFIKKDWS